MCLSHRKSHENFQYSVQVIACNVNGGKKSWHYHIVCVTEYTQQNELRKVLNALGILLLSMFSARSTSMFTLSGSNHDLFA